MRPSILSTSEVWTSMSKNRSTCNYIEAAIQYFCLSKASPYCLRAHSIPRLTNPPNGVENIQDFRGFITSQSIYHKYQSQTEQNVRTECDTYCTLKGWNMPRSNGCNIEVALQERNITLMLLKWCIFWALSIQRIIFRPFDDNFLLSLVNTDTTISAVIHAFGWLK